MYDKIKECVWDNVEPYYNTGKGHIFMFDGAEEGKIWIIKDVIENNIAVDIDCMSGVPYDLIDEFILFAKFVKQHVKTWQESEEGKKRIKIINKEINNGI